jgi:Putative zinc finger motif, C2HC5-type
VAAARIHALSEYTPLCIICGLVLCALHPPHRPCPHCTKPLLAPPARTALIAQLEELRAHTLAEEAATREREAEELRLAEGAFPVLSSQRSGSGATTSAPSPSNGAPQPQQQHRVLSLGAHTICVKTITTTRMLGSAGSGRGTLGEEGEEEEVSDGLLPRVPPPPREVEYVRVQRGSATRWADLKGDGAAGGAKYVVSLSLPDEPPRA